MTTVVPLRENGIIPGVIEEPNQDLIDMLEEMLKDAKSGHARALAYVIIDRDRAVTTGWSGNADNHDFIAGLTKLQFRYMLQDVSDDCE